MDGVPPLSLTPEPSPENGDGGLSAAQFKRWAALYGTEHRQLRRWIERGRQNSDPCPLDNPLAMPGWIENNIKKVHASLRERVNQVAAEAAKASAPPEIATDPTPDASGKSAESPPPASTAQVAPQKNASIDLATVGGVEGEQVALFRTLFAATKQQLEAAYLDGTETTIQRLLARLDKVGEALIKHQKAAEAKAKLSGKLIPEAQYAADWAQAVDLFKQMREHRKKAVLSEIPDADPAIKEKVAAAIERVSAREDEAFMKLGTFNTADDLLLSLAA